MPIIRYFIFVGLALLGGLFAVDYFVPKQETTIAVVSETDEALANWRAAEARKSVHARSASTNNFTQSYAMFAPSPAFGLSAHDEPALDARTALDAAVKGDGKADTSVAVKTDAPRKPRRQQVAQKQPSANSLRQDAMARAAFARQQQRQAFFQPQWQQPAQPPQARGFREANARMTQNPFAPRFW